MIEAEVMNLIRLNESRDYPLYHATSVRALASIINEDKLKAVSPYTIRKDKIIYGISLTRDYRFAKRWIRSEVIIEFRSDILNYNYKLMPRGKTNVFQNIQFTKNGKSEEFLVIGDSKDAYISNVRRYIRKVYVKSAIDTKYDLVNQILDEGIDADLIY